MVLDFNRKYMPDSGRIWIARLREPGFICPRISRWRLAADLIDQNVVGTVALVRGPFGLKADQEADYVENRHRLQTGNLPAQNRKPDGPAAVKAAPFREKGFGVVQPNRSCPYFALCAFP